MASINLMIFLLHMSTYLRMTGIYGGNTSEGSPEECHLNIIHLDFSYHGYEKGFLGYATNKYKQEAKNSGKNTR